MENSDLRSILALELPHFFSNLCDTVACLIKFVMFYWLGGMFAPSIRSIPNCCTTVFNEKHQAIRERAGE